MPVLHKESRLKLQLKSPKDFWAGLIYLGIGATAAWLAGDYGLGTAVRMGPGYFPTILATLLCLTGVVSITRALRVQGDPVGSLNLRGIILVGGAVLLFSLLARPLGLVIAIPLLIFVSAYASSHFRPKATLGVAIGLTIFCAIVFIKGLGIPLPLIGTGFGG